MKNYYFYIIYIYEMGERVVTIYAIGTDVILAKKLYIYTITT